MKFAKGASGVEMVPNLERWKGLPSLIKVCLMVFNTTFNNILLVEETGEPGESHRPVASHWQTLSHNVVHLTLIEILNSQR